MKRTGIGKVRRPSSSGSSRWIPTNPEDRRRVTISRLPMPTSEETTTRQRNYARRSRAIRAFSRRWQTSIAVEVARGDLRAARQVADRYVSLDPESARALYSRGILALRTGDAATARDDFGKLLHATRPTRSLTTISHSPRSGLSATMRPNASLRTALALAPSYARAQFALGVVLLREGRRRDARDAFSQASATPGADPALQNIAAAMRDSITI